MSDIYFENDYEYDDWEYKERQSKIIDNYTGDKDYGTV